MPKSKQKSSPPDKKTEDEELPPHDITQRNQYKPSIHSPQHATTTAIITKYLDDTKIEENFNKMLILLFGLSELPYNPYPGFIRRFRVIMERFHMEQKTEEEIRQLLVTKLEPSHLAYIYQPLNCSYVWGLRNITEIVEPATFKSLVSLFDTLAANASVGAIPKNYSKQVMLALIGPAVFKKSFHAMNVPLQVRMEYLITGPDASEGIEIFLNSVVNDIIRTETHTSHVLLGIRVPRKSSTDPEVWMEEFWDFEGITKERGTFKRLVNEAVASNRYVVCEALFCVDDNTKWFLRGEKQYALNYIHVSPYGEDEGISYFTEFPLVTLHEGVFLKQSHAESYLSTFTAKPDLLDQKAEDKSNSSSKKVSRQSKRTSRTEEPTDSVGRIRLDGFLLGDRAGYTPDAWQVTGPIKSAWQRKIASLTLHTELFDIINYILLLLLMDREAYADSLMIEIYYLFHSTAARLQSLMNLNKTIREVMIKFGGHEEHVFVTSMFMKYKNGLSELFNNILQERPSDQVTCIKAITSMLEDMVSYDPDPTRHGIPLTKRNVETLKHINSYSFTLMLGLTEDALAQCPGLKELVDTFQQTFPDDVPKSASHRRQSHQGSQTGSQQTEDYKHGYEDEGAILREKQVIDVEMCMKRGTAPKAIAVESVLLRYLVDTHLDRIWPEFLIDIVTGDHLPPNPYAQLVTTLRQAANKMYLQNEDSDKVSRELLQNNIRVEDDVNFVYHIPGCDAHGHWTAVTLLDAAAFFQLAPVYARFIQKQFKMRQGPYRIAICCAVSGFTTLFGKIDPYLRQIELQEHCYAKGPDGCWSDAIQIYSKIVYEHIRELYNQHSYFMYGILLGDHQTTWSVEDVVNRKKGFAAEFEKTAGLKQSIRLKIYVLMGWRLVPVVKHFNFHYINDEETKHDVMFQENQAHIYQNIFLEKERAAFHFQYGGPPDKSDPCNTSNLHHVNHAIGKEVLRGKEHQDWLNVYRWLLIRNIINHGSSLVGDVWRMLHSVASEIEYVNSLAQSLQDLIRYQLNIQTRHATDDTYYHFSSVQDEENDTKHLQSSLGHMVDAYYEKVMSVCNADRTLAPQALGDTIQKKLDKITRREPSTGRLSIVANTKSVYVLDEIINMLHAVQDATACDIHSMSPHSIAMLASIEAEYPSRADSVASVHLNDYSQYRHQPIISP